MSDAWPILDYAASYDRPTMMLDRVRYIGFALLADAGGAVSFWVAQSLGILHNGSFGGCATGRANYIDLMFAGVICAGASLFARAAQRGPSRLIGKLGRLGMMVALGSYITLWLDVCGWLFGTAQLVRSFR